MCIRDRIKRIKLSLYGHNSKLHDFVTQMPGSFDFDKVISIIRYLKEYKLPLAIQVMLMKQNFPYYRGFHSIRCPKRIMDIMYVTIDNVVT